MWTHGAPLLVRAADVPAGSGNDQLVIILGGIIVALITAGGTVLVAVVNARSNRTSPSPPSPAGDMPNENVTHIREDVAVLRFRADDADERAEIVDRRLDQIERRLDIDNPRWKAPDVP